MADDSKDIALFRYQVIAPLLVLDGARGGLKATIERLATRRHEHPSKGLIAVGFGTIEEWFYAYKRDGLDGLEPRRRRDQGKTRRIDDEVLDFIETIAKQHPELLGTGILEEVQSRFGCDRSPSLSTLYRILITMGLSDRGRLQRRDHRAYAFELAGDCWQGDVMYGPSIPATNGTRRKTYLIAIIDDATRLICHAQFYFEQDLGAFKDCLKQALLKRGIPRRFYFDNGKIFRSRLFLHIAARLGAHLIHSRPYRPQGRAKIERWFLTVRRIFLARIDLDSIQDLDALNRLLFAWVEGHYHVRPHRGLGGETPLDAWVRLSEGVRPIPADVDLDEVFLSETQRRVGRDGTLALSGATFEAGPNFVGQKVTVRFDPFDLRRVWVLAVDGSLKAAFPVDRSANCRVRRRPESDDAPRRPDTSIRLESLERLADTIENEAEAGGDDR